MKAYLANGLFSESDQAYNAYLADRIRTNFPWMDLYVPQENEALNDKMGYASSVQIFRGDNVYLDPAEILIAVLDGAIIDEGVASEVARFTAFKEWEEGNEGQYRPRYVFGLYTDVRQQGAHNPKKIDALKNEVAENQFSYRNLYTIGAVKDHGIIATSSDGLIDLIDKIVPLPKSADLQMQLDLDTDGF